MGWSNFFKIYISFCSDSGFFTIFLAMSLITRYVWGGYFSRALYTTPYAPLPRTFLEE